MKMNANSNKQFWNMTIKILEVTYCHKTIYVHSFRLFRSITLLVLVPKFPAHSYVSLCTPTLPSRIVRVTATQLPFSGQRTPPPPKYKSKRKLRAVFPVTIAIHRSWDTTSTTKCINSTYTLVYTRACTFIYICIMYIYITSTRVISTNRQ